MLKHLILSSILSVLLLSSCQKITNTPKLNTGKNNLTNVKIEQTTELTHSTTQNSDTYSQANIDYVINNNTKKFHYPSCYYVKSIKSSNKQLFCGNRKELIDNNYSPCKKCNP